MADRKLTFAFQADVREAEKMKKAIREITGETSKLAKGFESMRSAMTGKGKVGEAALAKDLLGLKGLFKDLGETGKTVGKIFERDVSIGLNKMKRDLKDVNTQIHSLTRQYQHWGNLAKQNPALSGIAQGVRGQLYGAMTTKADLLAKLGEGQAAAAATAGAGGRGLSVLMGALGGMGLGGGVGGLLGAGLGLLGPAGIAAGAGIAAVRGIGGAYYQGKSAAHTLPLEMQAMHAQGTAIFGSGAWMGDHLAANRQMTGLFDPKYGAMRGAFYKEAMWNKGWGVLNPAVWAHKMGIMDTRSGMEFENRASIARAEADQRTRQMIEDADKRDPLMADVRNKLYGLARQKADLYWATLGGRGDTDATWKSLPKGTPFANEELAGIMRGLVAGGGLTAANKTAAVAGWMQSGFSSADATRLLLGSAASGNVMNAMANLRLDPLAKVGIGSAVNQYLSPSQMISGQASIDALSSVLGRNVIGDSASQLRTMQQNVAGLGLLNNLTAGAADPWQKSVNLSNAIQNFGYGKSIYAQNALANLSYADMVKFGVGGKVSPALEGLGIRPEHVLAQKRSLERSFFSRWADDGTDQGEGARILREIRDRYGGDFSSWAGGRDITATKRAAGLISGLVSQIGGGEGGLFGGAADAEGIADILLGKTPTGGKGGKPGWDTNIELLKRSAEASERIADVAANIHSTIKAYGEIVWYKQGTPEYSTAKGRLEQEKSAGRILDFTEGEYGLVIHYKAKPPPAPGKK